MPRKIFPVTHSPPGPGAAPRLRVLLLGAAADLPGILREADGASAVLAPFDALDAGLLARVRPERIVAPLIGTDLDLADLTERLALLGFAGVLRCHCRPLPRRDEVLQALAEAFPDIRVEIVERPR